MPKPFGEDMSDIRYKHLMACGGLLTTEEIDEGWHFCYDWDELLIHNSWTEAEVCTCKK